MSASRRTIFAGASAVVLLLPAGAAAQGEDDETCCFANVRYAGVCRVVPEPDRDCGDVLAYLNDIASTGRRYCGSTWIRRGWSRVPCDGSPTDVKIRPTPYTGEPVARVPPGGEPPAFEPPEGEPPGFEPPEGDAPAGEVASRPASAEPVFLTPTAPQELGTAGGTDEVRVRLEQPVDDTLVGRGEFTGRLIEPLAADDGTVLAPRGALVFGTVEPSADGRTRLRFSHVLVDDEMLPIEGSAGLAPEDPAALGTGAVVAAPVSGIGTLSPGLTSLRRAVQQWREAFVAGDVEGVMRWYSDHAVMSPPASAPVSGRGRIAAYWQRRLDERPGRVELENVDAGVEGTLGFAAARYRLLDDAEETISSGRVLEVWRLHGGQWRIERASWTVEPASR